MKYIKDKPQKLKDIVNILEHTAYTRGLGDIRIRDKDSKLKEITYHIPNCVNIYMAIEDFILQAVADFKKANPGYDTNLDEVYSYFIGSNTFESDLLLVFKEVRLLSLEELLDNGFTLKEIQKISF